MVNTKQEILDSIRENREKIQQFGVKKIGLFGSFSRNEQTDASDVDFIVEFEKGKKTFDNFMDLLYYLEELLGREVEILTEEGVNGIRIKEVAERIKGNLEYV